MRDLTGAERSRLQALEQTLEANPNLRPALTEHYAISRAQVHDLRDALDRRLAMLSRHPDEPGSKASVRYRDGLAPYGTEDTTGFAPGCVF